MSEADDPVTEHIAAKTGWRGAMLAEARALICAAEPEISEAIKWRKPTNPLGVIAWDYRGLICTGETYKDKVKFTFAYGAALDDPAGLFNAGFGGNTRRAIDLFEGDTLNADAFATLIRTAAAHNAAKKAGK